MTFYVNFDIIFNVRINKYCANNAHDKKEEHNMFKNFFQKYGNNFRSNVDYSIPPVGSISHTFESAKVKECNKMSNSSFDFSFEKASIFATRCINIVTKIFVSSIIYFVLAHFVPELREKLPDMYRLVDALLSVLNSIFSFVLGIFGL